MAFLEGPAAIDDVAAKAAHADGAIRSLLKDDYVPSYVSGRSATVALQKKLLTELNDANQQADEKRADAQAQTQEKLEGLKDQEQSLAQSSQKVNASFQEKLAGIDEKLNALDKQFQASLDAEKKLILQQTLIQNEMSRLQQILDYLQNPPPNSRPTQFNRRQVEQELAVLQQQYALTVNQYAFLIQSRYELSQAAQQLLAQRQAIAGQYQATAAEMQAQQIHNQRWQARLDQTAKKQAKTPNEKLAPAAGNLRRRMAEFSTYDKGGLEEQRAMLNALLRSPVAEEQSDAK